MTIVKGYGYTPRVRRRRRVLASAGLVVAFTALGVMLLRAGHAVTVNITTDPGNVGLAGDIRQSGSAASDVRADGSAAATDDTASGNRLFRPYAMGLAPYAYLPYGDVSMASYADASGARNFFGAFILSSGAHSGSVSGCTPLWDGADDRGLASPRSKAILDDMTAVRARGGDVAVSFGGETGTELADSCDDTAKLQAAYRSVIETYKVRHINFDIEGKAQTNAGSLARRVQTAAALQKVFPGLKISLTLPVGTGGLDGDALNVVTKFRDDGVVLSNIGIMTMHFGGGPDSEAVQVIAAAKAVSGQLRQLYAGISTAEAYRALIIIPQLGVNQGGEVFTLADARTLHDFAVLNRVGTLSFWSAVRDQPCGSNLSDDMCSGVSQNRYQYGRTMAIPAL